MKKQLKKNSQAWQEYLENRRMAKERHESLDVIFAGNYHNSSKIIRRIIRTGR